MNIFVLNEDPIIAAREHCDKHVVKMIVETAQLLSTAHHRAGSATDTMYRPTHANHPCAVWVRASTANYRWSHSLLVALLDEYSYRYDGRIHGTARLVDLLEEPSTAPINTLTPFAQAMPDEYRSDNAVTAYRRFYRGAKRPFARWKRRPAPSWWEDEE